MHPTRSVFYKYQSAATAIAVLSARRLRWSSPLSFNDPFDVTQTLRLDIDPAVLQPVLVDAFINVLKNPAPPAAATIQLKLIHTLFWRATRPSDRDSILDELRSTSGSPTAGGINAFDELQKTWNGLVPQFRILCLSESPTITPMWNHYADAYKGTVLEFQADVSVDSALQLAKPVIYQDTPPRIADVNEWARAIVETNGKRFHELFREMQYVKATSWAYEKEWRVVSYARPDSSGLTSDLGFHPKEVRGLYLGPNTLPADEAVLRSLLVGDLNHVTVYKGRLPTGKATAFLFNPSA